MDFDRLIDDLGHFERDYYFESKKILLRKVFIDDSYSPYREDINSDVSVRVAKILVNKEFKKFIRKKKKVMDVLEGDKILNNYVNEKLFRWNYE